MDKPKDIEKTIYYKQKISYPIIMRPLDDNGCCFIEIPDFNLSVYSSSRSKALFDAKQKLKQEILQNYKNHVKLPAASFLARPYDVFKYNYIWSSITVTIYIPFDVWRMCGD